MFRGFTRGFLVPALLIAGACARSSEPAAELGAIESPVSVQVTNRHALPMEINVVGGGITQRLGTVHPGLAGRFRVSPNLVGSSSVRFEARPSGGGQTFRSGELLLAPGAFVDFVIAAQLFNSTVTRRL